MESDINKLKNILSNIEKKFIIDNGIWLDHLTPSEAFLTCIGAGPWKVKRRNLVQKKAVIALNKMDLSEINNISVFGFPLFWQNQKTENLIKFLKENLLTMISFTNVLKKEPDAIKVLYEVTKTKGRAKVLDLFARDFLKIKSFPIDRHVKQMLKNNGFPIDENYMIELCEMAELDASHVARAFVSGSGKFTGNGEV